MKVFFPFHSKIQLKLLLNAGMQTPCSHKKNIEISKLQYFLSVVIYCQ